MGMKNAVGKLFRTLGTIQLPFSFKGEDKIYLTTFHVLPKSTFDVILGRPFLHLTETLTRYRDRIIRTVRDRFSRKVCLTGNQYQWMYGFVNGQYTNAVGDSGSDICLTSPENARLRGWKVDTRPKRQKELSFVDGSTVRTDGVVRGIEWKFDPFSATSYKIDVYVLEGLHVDLLLDYKFIHDTDVYTSHAEWLFEMDDFDLEMIDLDLDGFLLNPIKTFHIMKVLFGRREQVPTVAQLWDERWNAELNDLERHCDAARLLSGSAQTDALNRAYAKWQAYIDSDPRKRAPAASGGHSTSSSSNNASP